MNELVSIVVPVYNMGSSIEECVLSLIKQDYENIEIILVDDGSKDDSYARCQKLAAQDKRVVAYHTENRGSGPARNYGIEHAKGKYIYFPDADDFLKPVAVSKMLSAMENGKYDLIVFGYSSLNHQGKEVFRKEYPEFAKSGDVVRADYSDYMGSSTKYGIQGAPWNKFFDLEVIRAHKVEYPPLRRHQDEGFIARYMCHAKYVHFIEDVLYVHYVNDLGKEWDKFPVDYIDVVIGLNDTRKETILTWNPDDSKTREMIEREFICNVIKSCELTFSPKMNLTRTQRQVWVKDVAEKTNLTTVRIPSNLGKYQRVILNFLKRGKIKAAIRLMHLKVIIQKNGFLTISKKLYRKIFLWQ
jgi:glycosyltransferase involved in cell wall biosynthesis